jgi:hypothetical protein
MKSAISRRAFLTRASTGAMAIGALSSVSGLATTAYAQTDSTQEAPEITLAEPFVVYIHDPSAGEVAFITGTEEVTRHDPELVARLLKLMS